MFQNYEHLMPSGHLAKPEEIPGSPLSTFVWNVLSSHCMPIIGHRVSVPWEFLDHNLFGMCFTVLRNGH